MEKYSPPWFLPPDQLLKNYTNKKLLGIPGTSNNHREESLGDLCIVRCLPTGGKVTSCSGLSQVSITLGQSLSALLCCELAVRAQATRGGQKSCWVSNWKTGARGWLFSGIQYHLRHLSYRLPAGVFIFYCCHNKLSRHFCVSVSGYSMAHSGPLLSLPRLKLKCQQVCVPFSGLGQIQFLAVWAVRSCWLSSRGRSLLLELTCISSHAFLWPHLAIMGWGFLML